MGWFSGRWIRGENNAPLTGTPVCWKAPAKSIPIRLRVPHGQVSTGWFTKRSLTLTLRLLPDDFPSPTSRREAQTKARAAADQAARHNGGYKWTVSVPGSGKEAFTPEALEVGRVYKLTFTGIFNHSGKEWFSSRRAADAVFSTDNHDSFTQRYAGVQVDGLSAGDRELDSWTEDRAGHSYSCLLDGRGERMPIQVRLPSGRVWDGGNLSAEIEIMPPSTPSVATRQQARAAAKETQKLQEEAARQAQKLQEEAASKLAEEQARQEREKQARQKHESAVQRRVLELLVMVQHQQFLLDPTVCTHFVKKNQQQLLLDKAAWIIEYQKLLADEELVAALKRKALEVLEFYVRRVEMIILAEKLAFVPPDSNVCLTERKITPRSLGRVENAVSKLFDLRDHLDSLEENQVIKGFDASRQQQIEIDLKTMRYFLELLKAYGITADTPERAEEKFFELCPYQPVLTVYENIIARIRAGEQVDPDAVKNRLENLFREEIIVQAKRRRAVRIGRDQYRDFFDQRLAVVRQESTELRDFLVSIKQSVEFPDYRAREESREEQFN